MEWASTRLLFMVFAVAWAPMIANFPGLFQYLQEALSSAP